MDPAAYADVIQRKLAAIDRYAETLQDRPLVHNGRSYYADRHSLNTITTTLSAVQMLANIDPVPTPPPVAGKWMSADRDPETGQRVLVAMTCAEFKLLARALYDRNAALWGAKQAHKATIEAMAAAGATVEAALAAAQALGLADTDPVRVPPPLQPGWWLNTSLDEGGNRVAVPMTVGGLKALVVALYDRNGLIWGAEMVHKATIEAMAASGSTAAEILAYEHLQGWPE